MKKNITISVVAVIVAICCASYVLLKPTRTFTKTELENIEALASGESDCDYINGYRTWKIEAPWPWSDRQAFYDCCKVLRSGYSPEDICTQ
jgi:hypothetical protein